MGGDHSFLGDRAGLERQTSVTECSARFNTGREKVSCRNPSTREESRAGPSGRTSGWVLVPPRLAAAAASSGCTCFGWETPPRCDWFRWETLPRLALLALLLTAVLMVYYFVVRAKLCTSLLSYVHFL